MKGKGNRPPLTPRRPGRLEAARLPIRLLPRSAAVLHILHSQPRPRSGWIRPATLRLDPPGHASAFSIKRAAAGGSGNGNDGELLPGRPPPAAARRRGRPVPGGARPERSRGGRRVPGGRAVREGVQAGAAAAGRGGAAAATPTRSRSCSPPPSPPTPPSPSSGAALPASPARLPSPPAAFAPSSSTRFISLPTLRPLRTITSAAGRLTAQAHCWLMQGMHGLGGRMATRFVERGEQLVFDHAAQFFTASDERFQRLVDEWVDRGLVREWSGLVGELEAGGHFRPIPSLTPRYIGVNGMRPLADAILPQTDMIKVLRPCWISKLEPFNGLWRLFENEKPHGEYNAIVIAHNGKCANRLLSTSGLPLLTKQMKRLELSSVWALLAAFEDPLPVPRIDSHGAFEGAFVRDVDSLSWVGNNTCKLLPMQTGTPECWTFFSTAAYGKRNKVPQVMFAEIFQFFSS